MQHNISGAARGGGLLLLSSLFILLQCAAGFQAPRSLTPVSSSYRNGCSSSHIGRHVCIISAAQFQQRRRQHDVTTLRQKTTDSDTDEIIEEETSSKPHSNILSQAYHLYADYFDRLWSETDVDHRHKRAKQRARDSVLRMKNMVGDGLGDEYLWQTTADANKKEGGGVVGALIKKRGKKEQVFYG